MNGIVVLPTRVVCGLLLAWLALAGHSDTVELRAFRGIAVQFQEAGLRHGQNSPIALASAAFADDDADRSRAEPPDLPLALRPFVPLPGSARSHSMPVRAFALIRHGPCAAPQTGPPDLHAA